MSTSDALTLARAHLHRWLCSRMQNFSVDLAPRIQAAVDAGGGPDEIKAILQEAMADVVSDLDEFAAAFTFPPGQAQ